MSYQVVFTKEAELDLVGIEEYLSQFYAGTVRSFFEKLKKKVSLLETMPYMYPEYDADPFFRRMVIGDYLLFYAVDEEREQIVIHRIFHSARDISQQILSKKSY